MFQINFLTMGQTQTSNQKFKTRDSAEHFAESWNLPYYSIEEV